jgi:hypothetical protein
MDSLFHSNTIHEWEPMNMSLWSHSDETSLEVLVLVALQNLCMKCLIRKVFICCNKKSSRAVSPKLGASKPSQVPTRDASRPTPWGGLGVRSPPVRKEGNLFLAAQVLYGWDMSVFFQGVLWAGGSSPPHTNTSTFSPFEHIPVVDHQMFSCR